jgi:transposase
LIHLGMDVHKDSISIGILRPDDSLDLERIFHDEESVRRFIARMGEPRRLVACYEAGPTGYELQRLLQRLQVPCHVVAPSLIPKAPGDRVKTDRRDCRRLARLHRAGELVTIRVPSPEEEAVRDLARARGDVVIDLDRARRRLGAFLLRHGQVWRGGSNWTLRHQQWLLGLRFDDAALASTFAHYRSIVEERRLRLQALQGHGEHTTGPLPRDRVQVEGEIRPRVVIKQYSQHSAFLPRRRCQRQPAFLGWSRRKVRRAPGQVTHPQVLVIAQVTGYLLAG